MNKISGLILFTIFTMGSAQTVPGLPIPIGAGTAEVWNDSIYFFGGSNHWWGYVLYPRIYQYDGSSWSYQDSIPDNNVWGVQSVLVGDEVYLVGGWPAGAGLLRKYNLTNHSWSYLNSSSNLVAYGFTTQYFNGFIYLFNQISHVYQYDITTDTWHTKTANSKQGYAGLSSIVFQDEIYILGYADSSFFKYTPATDQWTQLANTPYQVAGCSMGIINGLMYCVGGNSLGNSSGLSQNTLVYDIAANSWTSNDFKLSAKRHWMATADYLGRTYVVGGFDSTNHAVDIVEEIVPQVPLVLEEPGQISTEFSLDQNFPNPFNPSTTISYHLSRPATVKLEIFDLAGKRVAILVDGWKGAGNHSVQWNARNTASGIYIYRMQYQGKVQTRPMVLLK